MPNLTSGRRSFFRLTTLLPFLAVSSQTTAAADEFCAELPEHPAVGNNDDEFEAVRDALWDEFVAGAQSLGGEVNIPQSTKNYIIAQQSVKLKRKVRFWSLCESETRYCAFSAGVVAEAERRAAERESISNRDFDKAKAAVQQMQKKRLGREVVGIAC